MIASPPSGSFPALADAVRLTLAPLVDDASADIAGAVGLKGVIDAVSHTATVARRSGLRDYGNYLSGVAGGLEARRSDPPDPDAIRKWLQVVVNLCRGQADQHAPEMLAELGRLFGARESAASLRAQLRDDLRALGLAQASEASEASQAFDDIAEVGADELEMLAQACRELDSQLGASPAVTTSAALDLIAERAGYVANALRFMSLPALADLFDHFAGRLHGQAASNVLPDATQASALRDWPRRWASWFSSLDAERFDEAVAVHAMSPWLAPGLLAQARSAVLTLRVVRSRRTMSRRDDVTDRDMSLVIPEHSDPEVVEQLLRELPALTAEFTDAVTAIAGQQYDQLAKARRAAHTIKGAANTVGVAGIANLTHALEDLLHLLDKADAAPEPAVIDTLCVAADCLAEIAESLVGMADAPDNSIDIYRSVLAAVNLVADRLDAEDSKAREPVAAAPAESPSGGAKGALEVEPEDEDFDEIEASPAGAASIMPAFNITDFDLPDLDLPDLDLPPMSTAPRPADAQPGVSPLMPAGLEPKGIESLLEVPVMGAASTWANWSVPVAGGNRLTGDASASSNDGAAAEDAGEEPVDRRDNSMLRVAGTIIDRLLESADEAVIALSELQDVVRELAGSHQGLRAGSQRLDGLAVELDRLMDRMSVSMPTTEPPAGFDPLEFERYGDLHTVAQRLAESASDGKLLEQQIDHQVDRAGIIVDKLERVQSLVRDTALRARMVDAASIAPRLQRAARQAARLAGKSVSLSLQGGATAVDSETLQRLVEPLAHLVRNAVDHGIEAMEQRRLAGKSETGEITVSFEREASAVIVVVEDDGAGLNLPAIAARARGIGLLHDDLPIDARVAAQLILAPGFTTRERPTQLSGRGVGLDVVHQAVRGLRGTTAVATEAGAGTRFELTLPLQLTALPAFVLRSSTHVIAVSVRGVEEIIADTGALVRGPEGLRLDWQGRRIEVRRLDEVLGLPVGMLAADPALVHEVLMIVRVPEGGAIGVLLPEPRQARQVVVRALPEYMPRIIGIDGVAVLGDGAVASVVDLSDMLAGTAGARPDPRRLGRMRQAMPVCLVVDDSVSVRRAMAHFMTDIGLQCEVAADGEAALVSLERQIPDVVVLDLEMPRMSGIELTQALRRDVRTRTVPIIMITSRQSDKHRAIAMAAGVDRFLTKPYSEDQLATVVSNCLAGKPHAPDGR